MEVEKLAPYYGSKINDAHVKVERFIHDRNELHEMLESRIKNKNGDFILRVDKDLELCSMQFNGSSGRWMKEDLIKLKALLNSCNLI